MKCYNYRILQWESHETIYMQFKILFLKLFPLLTEHLEDKMKCYNYRILQWESHETIYMQFKILFLKLFPLLTEHLEDKMKCYNYRILQWESHETIYMQFEILFLKLFPLLTEQLEDKMKWLKNFERVQEIQRHLVWPTVTDLDPRAFIPEVCMIMIKPCHLFSSFSVYPRSQYHPLHQDNNNRHARENIDEVIQ